ncbi:MAG: hypothetical protein ACE5KF_09950 [Kiloniellaceae bacterium]
MAKVGGEKRIAISARIKNRKRGWIGRLGREDSRLGIEAFAEVQYVCLREGATKPRSPLPPRAMPGRHPV